MRAQIQKPNGAAFENIFAAAEPQRRVRPGCFRLFVGQWVVNLEPGEIAGRFAGGRV